jgi:hypothetical protein
MFFASTVAPETTPPEASVTVPKRVALEICAKAVPAQKHDIAVRQYKACFKISSPKR